MVNQQAVFFWKSMQLFEMFSYEKRGVSTKQLVTSPNGGFKKGRFPRCAVLGGCGNSVQVFPYF